MKLYASMSEAIREGAKIRPQATQLFERLLGGLIGSCAIGAAYEAITGTVVLAHQCGVYTLIEETYPYFSGDEMFPCPVVGCDQKNTGLDEAVMHLNDDHFCSRENIADWLETEEEKIGFVTVCEAERSNEMTLGVTTMERQDVVSAFP